MTIRRPNRVTTPRAEVKHGRHAARRPQLRGRWDTRGAHARPRRTHPES